MKNNIIFMLILTLSSLSIHASEENIDNSSDMDFEPIVGGVTTYIDSEGNLINVSRAAREQSNQIEPVINFYPQLSGRLAHIQNFLVIAALLEGQYDRALLKKHNGKLFKKKRSEDKDINNRDDFCIKRSKNDNKINQTM